MTKKVETYYCSGYTYTKEYSKAVQLFNKKYSKLVGTVNMLDVVFSQDENFISGNKEQNKILEDMGLHCSASINPCFEQYKPYVDKCKSHIIFLGNGLGTTYEDLIGV
jgi:hypothetical protein